MKRSLEFIEADEGLFRGFGARWPLAQWQPETLAWTMLADTSQRRDGWGAFVTEREAERLYPGAGAAPLPAGLPLERDFSGAELLLYVPELFDGYDGPMRRLSPDEEAEGRAQWERGRPR